MGSDEHIVVRDFNLHHPYWSGLKYNHQHQEAEALLTMLNEQKLELLLPVTIVGRRRLLTYSTVRYYR